MNGHKSRRDWFFLPVDWAIVVYLGSISLAILFFRENVRNWPLYLAFNFAAIGLVFSLARQLGNPQRGLARFIRHWYPIFLVTFLYEETGPLVHMFFPNWFDMEVVHLERMLTGVAPSVWLERFASRPLSEFLMFGYFSYYLLLPVVALFLWLKHKEREFDRMVFIVSVTFFVSYWGFYLYPVQGPRWAIAGWHTVPIKGWVFVPLANFFIDQFAVRGGAMPSSHVAVALVALLFAWRNIRWLGIVLTPVVAGLAVGTVYGRFHYASDVIVGIAIGWGCDFVLRRWLARRTVFQERPGFVPVGMAAGTPMLVERRSGASPE